MVARNFVVLDPNSRPAHVFRVRRFVGMDGTQDALRMSKAVWSALCIAVLLFGCGQSKEQAIQELEKLNVRFTPDDFVRSAENGDMKAVQLFFDAGIDCNAQEAAQD